MLWQVQLCLQSSESGRSSAKARIWEGGKMTSSAPTSAVELDLEKPTDQRRTTRAENGTHYVYPYASCLCNISDEAVALPTCALDNFQLRG